MDFTTDVDGCEEQFSEANDIGESWSFAPVMTIPGEVVKTGGVL